VTAQRVTLAVLILAHTNPAQVTRLVAHLEADFDVFVHLDKRSNVRIADFDEFGRTKAIKKVRATWGSLGIVRATLALLELASSGTGYDRYVLISGQDVPLKTNADIATFFAQHPNTDFVDSNFFTEAEESRLTRVSRFHFFPRRTFSRVLTTVAADVSRRLDALISLAGIRRSMRYRFRWGSQWMDLTSETTAQVLRLLHTDRGFLKRFRFTFCPDEVFFQTAIENCGRKNLSLASPRRYIDWQTGPEHPRVLRKEDSGRIDASDMLFARKCDTSVDPDLVERLYARLDRKG
jgi:Core-2/I-Branching enzyme